jgi:hypothetical protein
MVKVCECCGHPLPTLEVQLGLTPRQRDIFNALQKAGQRGLGMEELIHKVYLQEADGGPVTVSNVMCVQKIKMKDKLAAFGMQITSTLGHGAIWKLEKL